MEIQVIPMLKSLIRNAEVGNVSLEVSDVREGELNFHQITLGIYGTPKIQMQDVVDMMIRAKEQESDK